MKPQIFGSCTWQYEICIGYRYRKTGQYTYESVKLQECITAGLAGQQVEFEFDLVEVKGQGQLKVLIGLLKGVHVYKSEL